MTRKEVMNMTTQNAREQRILGWQINDRRQAALAGLPAAERLRCLAEEMSTATRMYPKAEDASKALDYAQNQVTWGFGNLLAAINDAAVKAYEADTLAATLAGLQRADAAAASPDLLAALEALLAHRECPVESPEAEAARRALAQARGEVQP